MSLSLLQEEKGVLVALEHSNNYCIPNTIPNGLFRAYDIRGLVAPESLTTDLAYAIGRAVGSMVYDIDQHQIIVGRDGRISSPKLSQALIQGLLDCGIEVLNLGPVPTPLVYFATKRLDANSGIMVTGSHNPGSHNGFKIVINDQTLASEGVQKVKHRILEQNFVSGKGNLQQLDVVSDYLQYIEDYIQLAKPLKVVVDCGNGIAGEIAPKLFRALGCEVIELFCEVDGHFPNHHPDPTVPENLNDIIAAVKNHVADCGVAFDGDADRLGIVTDQGEIIWPDRQLMAYAIDVLAKHPGAEIIFDVKCTRQLPRIIKQYGGKPVMWRTGHSVIKAKLHESSAPLAGEMSGHIFFKDGWFGFDDGIYVAARLIKILSEQAQPASNFFAALPNSYNTPELKLPMVEERKKEFMDEFAREADFGDAKIVTIDGLRVEYEHCWGLIRPSNTSPYLILRFEADTEAQLSYIKNVFSEQILKIDPTAQLPY